MRLAILVVAIVTLAAVTGAHSTGRALADGPAVVRIIPLPIADGSGFVHSLSVAPDGSGFFVAGAVTGSMAGQTPLGGSDLFVTKFSSDGTLMWGRQAGGGGSETAVFGNAVAATPDGGAVAVAPLGLPESFVPSGTVSSLLVVSYGADGTERWRKEIAGIGAVFVSVAVDEAGHVYVGGQMQGENDIRAFVRSFEAGGAERWTYHPRAGKSMVSALAAGPGDPAVFAVVLVGSGGGDPRDTAIEAIALDPTGTRSWRRKLGPGIALTGGLDSHDGLVIPAARLVDSDDIRLSVHRVAPDGHVAPAIAVRGGGLLRSVAPTEGGLLLGGHAEGKVAGRPEAKDGAFVAGIVGEQPAWYVRTGDFQSVVWGVGVLPGGRIAIGGYAEEELFGRPSPAVGAYVAILEKPVRRG